MLLSFSLSSTSVYGYGLGFQTIVYGSCLRVLMVVNGLSNLFLVPYDFGSNLIIVIIQLYFILPLVIIY